MDEHIKQYKKHIWRNLNYAGLGAFIKSNPSDKETIYKEAHFLWRLVSEMNATLLPNKPKR